MSDESAYLIHCIIALDKFLPHDTDAPERISDEPPPMWCACVKKALGTPHGECCNLCAELSPQARAALDDAFAEEQKSINSWLS